MVLRSKKVEISLLNISIMALKAIEGIKDSVNDETIFNDLVRLSGGRIQIPEGLHLGRIPNDQVFSRPGPGNPKNRMMRQKNGRMKNFKK